MAYQITDLCIECGRCVGVCPTQAIAVVEQHHRIDANTCDDVAMCVRYCPQPGAIVLIDDDHLASAREVGSQ
jgi:Fe-S-cluster-containing hydrogenase component 2